MSLNRRDFIRLSGLGTASLLLSDPLRLLAQGRRAEFTPLRRNVGIFTERGGTIGWLINDDGVVIVDSQFPDTAELLIEGVRQRTRRPIDVLINTHHHPDHSGGNIAFRGVAREIVAHSRSAANQREVARARGNEAEQEFPSTTFDTEWSVAVGDETVRVKYYGPAHTGGDVAIFFENANVVHLGDLLNNRGYPNIDVPAGASVGGWIRVLETVAPEYPPDALYIFGHAGEGFPLTGTRDDLFHQRDYFLGLLDAAARAIRDGRTREQLIAMQQLPAFEHFGGTHSRLGLGLGIAYDEMMAAR
ncbi:MAG TPA: MBL fold metallo-hydrolase [Longimicrobiaceae bacterium]|nr:MBL fold metallo-hydrolase [Longimicrobiaceae bacterium]